ncbi:MAG: hypothetical protein ACP5OP_06170 [Leptospirillia bacterium]
MNETSSLSGVSSSRPHRQSSVTWLSLAFLAGLLLLPALPAIAATTITIVSPAPDAQVQSPVVVKYKYHKEGRANHIHVIVDGQFRMVSHKSPVTMKLPAGKHTILLQAATKHHNLLDASAKVNVEVK